MSCPSFKMQKSIFTPCRGNIMVNVEATFGNAESATYRGDMQQPSEILRVQPIIEDI